MWTTFVVNEGWKLLVDLILPAVWPAYDQFIGPVENRTLSQRFMWIFLLQLIQMSVEIVAVCNYLILRRSITEQRNSNVHHDLPERSNPTDTAVTTMIWITSIEIVVSIIWATTPFTFTQTMISTPVFALTNNLAVVYVSVRNFGPIRQATKQYKELITSRCSTG